MQGAATPDFLWAVLTRGAPEKSSNGYIVGNKNLSQAWRTDGEFFFFSHPIIFEQLKGPIESIRAVLFSGQKTQPGMSTEV